MSKLVPNITPTKTKQFESKQSKYHMCAKLPMRSIILGPSGSGKTILLQNMILDIYRGSFSRIFIFSPTVNVDYSWVPVKNYIENEMKVKHTEEEPIFFDHYNAKDLQNIIDTQFEISKYMKDNNYKTIHQILVVIDDMADSPDFTRHSKLLHGLYLKGRHTFISSITATQVYTALSPLIRKNATELYVYRLRNYRDLESLVEELAALYEKKLLIEIYNKATSEPHSFLYINLMAKDKKDLFYMNFNKK